MKKKMMNNVAAIDVGSNSVRLLTVINNEKKEYVYNTRLGEGLSFSKTLGDNPIERTIKAIKSCKDLATSLGVFNIYIFATAAVRCADNKQVFIDRVKKETNLLIDVVSEKLEGKLGLLGAVDTTGGIIDIGGASTEIAYMLNDDVVYDTSEKIGVVRLLDLHKAGNNIDEIIDKTLDMYGNIPVGNYYAIGGTATSLASIKLNLTTYDRNKTHGTVLSYQDVYNILLTLKSMEPIQIENSFAISKGRGEVIVFGASILYNIMKKFNINSITVSENDNLEGYLRFIGYEA